MNQVTLYDSLSGNKEEQSFPIFPIITINFNILKGNSTEEWYI